MKWLGELLWNLGKVIVENLVKHVRWLGGRFTAVVVGIVSLLIVPVKAALAWLQALLEWATERLDEVTDLITNLNLWQLPNYWNTFSPYFSLVDNFVPLGLLTGTIAGLLSLQLICVAVRIVIRFLPSVLGNQIGGN